MYFGLIGKSLEHSLSKNIFEDKYGNKEEFDSYELYEVHNLSKLRELVVGEGLDGLNVTIPYKESVIPLLDRIEDKAKQIGSVNTIKIFWEGRILFNLILEGYNTDSEAFQESLKGYLTGREKNALILGTGGAAKSVAHALKNLDINFNLVSRDQKKGIRYEDLDKKTMKKYQIIVNATPLGMFPDIKSYPVIPYQFLGSGHLLYDLTYNPEETEFLKRGMEHGARTVNGLEMLELQAEKSWEIWNSKVYL